MHTSFTRLAAGVRPTARTGVLPHPLWGRDRVGGRADLSSWRRKWPRTVRVRRDPPPRSSPTRGEEAALRASGMAAASCGRCVHPVELCWGRWRHRAAKDARLSTGYGAGWGVARRRNCGSDCTTVTPSLQRDHPCFPHPIRPSGPPSPLTWGVASQGLSAEANPLCEARRPNGARPFGTMDFDAAIRRFAPELRVEVHGENDATSTRRSHPKGRSASGGGASAP